MIPLLHGIETFDELNNTPIDTLVNEKKIIFVCSEMIQNFLVKTTPDISIPFDKLLANGFNTRQADIRPANSVDTAFQLLAVIFQLQSLQ